MRGARRQKLQRIQKVTKRKLVEVHDMNEWAQMLEKAGGRLILCIFTSRGSKGPPVMMIQDIAAQPNFKHVIFANVDMDGCKTVVKDAQVENANSVRYLLGDTWLPGNPKTPEQVVQLLTQYAATAPRPAGGTPKAASLGLLALLAAGGAAAFLFLRGGAGGSGAKAKSAIMAPVVTPAKGSSKAASTGAKEAVAKGGSKGPGSTRTGGGAPVAAAPAPKKPVAVEEEDDDDDLGHLDIDSDDEE